MRNTADRVIDDYSSLNQKEQKEFDRRYRDLHKFRRGLKALVDGVTQKKKEAKVDAKNKVSGH